MCSVMATREELLERRSDSAEVSFMGYARHGVSLGWQSGAARLINAVLQWPQFGQTSKPEFWSVNGYCSIRIVQGRAPKKPQLLDSGRSMYGEGCMATST